VMHRSERSDRHSHPADLSIYHKFLRLYTEKIIKMICKSIVYIFRFLHPIEAIALPYKPIGR
jgi:hypothetical protein